MVNIADLEEGKKHSGEAPLALLGLCTSKAAQNLQDRSCPRRRTFTTAPQQVADRASLLTDSLRLNTEPNVRVVRASAHGMW